MIDSSKLLIIYILLINLYGFFVMYSDKKRARKKLWRTPEKNIFIVSLLGGSVGVLFGMYIFRHKTKHLKFTLGIPIIIIIQICIAAKILGYINY